MRRRYDLVLAIFLTSRGFSYCLFEGPNSPVDWGIVEKRGGLKNHRCLRAIRQLIPRCGPDRIVIEDTRNATHRTKRILRLNQSLLEVLAAAGVPAELVTRARVYQHFAQFDVSTRHGIAEVVAKQLPALDRYLPPERKPWMSEDSRSGLFCAAALALTFIHATPATSRAQS